MSTCRSLVACSFRAGAKPSRRISEEQRLVVTAERKVAYMLQQSLFRAVVTVAIILLACPILMPTFGQKGEQLQPKSEPEKVVPAFKGNGIARPSRSGQLITSPPPALGADVLAKLIGRAPGSVYARLTPSLPEVANRGALVFVHASEVEGGEGYAKWFALPVTGSDHEKVTEERANEEYLMLWLKSSANSKYVIDCFIGSPVPKIPFRVIALNSSETQTSTFAETKGHLIFMLEATTPAGMDFGFPAAAATGHSIPAK